jgi:iron(III) transport system permease protein
MKVESRTEPSVGSWEASSRFLPHRVTLFATGLSGLLLVLIGLPVLMVILMSFRTGFPGEEVPFTLENFATVYMTPRTYEVLLNTLFFATSSVFITLLIAVPLVWILMRTDIPFKKTIYVLLTIGILIPVFLRTIAWILLLSPRIGLVNKWVQEAFALSDPPFNLYSLTGMAFVQGVSFVPGAFFMLAAAYRSMDPSLEEAAYTSGWAS